ncbi:hypothetical protein [Methanothrix sp.]|uniref:hypothetical protein n=1 Tax=Methanothrix sp. TaxID=90426 RepID=UPI003C717ACC
MHNSRLVLLIAILALSGSAASVEWSDSNTNTINFVTGTPTAVSSGLSVDIAPGLQSKTVEHWAAGTNVMSGEIQTTEKLSVVDDSGLVRTYGTNSRQYITLPSQSSEGNNVVLQGKSVYDFSSGFDTLPDIQLYLTIDDPELEKLFNLGISAGDSPKDIINKFLLAFGESGLGRSMDRFLEPNNLMYGAEYEWSDSISRNGVTCSWGESQKVSVDYSWLKGV